MEQLIWIAVFLETSWKRVWILDPMGQFTWTVNKMVQITWVVTTMQQFIWTVETIGIFTLVANRMEKLLELTIH